MGNSITRVGVPAAVLFHQRRGHHDRQAYLLSAVSVSPKAAVMARMKLLSNSHLIAMEILRYEASRHLVVTGHGETAVPVEVGPVRGQPNQPGRAEHRGAYPSSMLGGYSTATACGDDSSDKASEGNTSVRRCVKCRKKGHRIANCT